MCSIIVKSQRRKLPKRWILFPFSSENLTSVNDANFAGFHRSYRPSRRIMQRNDE
jgi:hypothetical protein